MDKYEFQIKTEHMEKLLEKEDYQTAAKVADSIDWRKVHDVELLMKVSSIYEKLERYEDSYEILNIAYDRSPIGRMIVYKMAEIALKMGEINEAVELYKEFTKIAPHDLGRYVLKYKIYKERGSSVEDQIAILEEYKSREYQEQWAYELATLYYKEGMLSKCVEECDDLILWFSEGEYVAKAMELKMRIQPLTASQEEKYRQMVEEREASQIEVKPVNVDEFNTTNLQAALAESLQNFMKENKEKVSKDTRPTTPIPEKAEKAKAENSKEAKNSGKELSEKTESFEEAKAPKELERQEESKEAKVPWTPPVRPLSRDTFPMPKFLGQNENGQLTFDMQENVLERQITGQMTISDILNDWEVKKRETEAAIAEAAKRDEERKKERERLRATGQLPDLNTEVATTVPEEIQRLIDEIEGRIPVKIHVEPLLREPIPARGEEPVWKEKKEAAPEPEEVVLPEQEELALEPEPPLPAEQIPEEILDILESLTVTKPVEKGEETTQEETPEESLAEEQAWEAEWTLPSGMDEILDILESDSEVFLQEEKKEEEENEEEEEECQPVSPMIDDLEKALAAEFQNLPPGQLSEEQKKLFAYFTSVRGMSRQLAELLEEDRMRKGRREDSLLGNIVITGERGNGKTTLAADIVKALQRQRGVKDSEMAKVAASSLNGKNVSTVIDKLEGGALLIEKAGNLKTETAVQLSHAMTRKTGGLLVLLEDEAEEIRDLFIRCESLGAKFTRTIDIPTFTNKELVAFGESYALERECVLDEMAVLALYNRIGNNQTSDHLVNVAEVKEMVDEAIDRGGKKGLFGKVKKSRRDEFGHTILLERDFEI